MTNKILVLTELSKLMGWQFEVQGTYVNFKGYREWRKAYNGDLESVLFSTGKINEFDEQGFIKWLDRLPSQARFRVKTRVFYSKVAEDSEELKYPKLKTWFEAWEKFKEDKQKEQRVLEEKVRQGQATEDDKEKLVRVKKEAKVTVGATNFNELYKQIREGKIDTLMLESFLNKVNLPYNSLVLVDDSGSMRGAPFNFAIFIASVCLVKNPDDDARNLLGFFNTSTHFHTCIDRSINPGTNSLIGMESIKVSPEPFVDPTKSFIENYSRIGSFSHAVFQNGGTRIDSIPEYMYQELQDNKEILDGLMNYPIWTIISDGEWNNMYTPEASINEMMAKCQKYFGYKPFIVAIDIARWTTDEYFMESAGRTIERFTGIENFMYIPSNPAQIEQFLTNFKDMDVMDIYTPLQSIHRSNRYELVRANTL